MHACDRQSDAAAGSHPHHGFLGGSFVYQEGIGRKSGALAYHDRESAQHSVSDLEHSPGPEAGAAPGFWGQAQVQLGCEGPEHLDCCE